MYTNLYIRFPSNHSSSENDKPTQIHPSSCLRDYCIDFVVTFEAVETGFLILTLKQISLKVELLIKAQVVVDVRIISLLMMWSSDYYCLVTTTFATSY